MVNESTDEDELVEERKEKEVELEKIMAVPTVSVPKEIPLSSGIEDSFDKIIVLSQPSDFSIRISCFSSINTPLYINLTKTKHLITEMHPINHDSKRLLDRRCKDIFLRLVWHPPWETHALEWPPLTVGYFLNRKEPFGQAYSVQKMNFGICIFSHLKPTFNRTFTAKVWEVEFVDFLAKEPYTEGAELIHFVLDMIHKETKDCDYLAGFQIYPSLIGGTKFGVMVWIFMGYWYQIEQLRLKKKGYKVLFMVDAIEEYAFGQLKEYGGREGIAPKLFDEMLEGMLATYLNMYRVKRPFGFNGENDAAATTRQLAGLEMYKITAGLGGSEGRPELCVWSLLSLRCGVLVSADNTGSVHFWSNQHGTFFQAHVDWFGAGQWKRLLDPTDKQVGENVSHALMRVNFRPVVDFMVVKLLGCCIEGARIQLEFLFVKFHGHDLIIQFELELNSGRYYGLLGLNGCGKSILLMEIGCRDLPIPDHMDILPLTREIEPSDIAPDQDDLLPSKIQSLCPAISGNVCCTEAQFDTLRAQDQQAIPFLMGCPACLRNFLNIFCELSCSPDQGLFINVTTSEVKDNMTVDGINFFVTDTFGEGLYNSYKHVKFGTMNTRAIDFIGAGAKNFKELLGLHEKYSSTCSLFTSQELSSAISSFAHENMVGKGDSPSLVVHLKD